MTLSTKCCVDRLNWQLLNRHSRTQSINGNADNGSVKMRSRKRSFRHQSLQDEKSIQDILQSITNGIARGKITFSDEDEKIVMRPEGLLDLKVTATQEENRNRFNIRISWQLDDSREKRKKSLSVK